MIEIEKLQQFQQLFLAKVITIKKLTDACYLSKTLEDISSNVGSMERHLLPY